MFNKLSHQKYTWLVTGAAGFIGSHLVEKLLQLDQRVIGLDNFYTGLQQNIEAIKQSVSSKQFANFEFINGDIRDLDVCLKATENCDFILHHAALGSVPLSFEDPKLCHDINVTGFLNILMAAKQNNVKRVIYASSSAVYGDSDILPAVEDKIGNALSPYALSKRSNELYADIFYRAYGLQTVGLRYFNIFGPRQDPKGSYAAVIPSWILSILENRPVRLNGDGKTTRDFLYVDNVVQANLFAALSDNVKCINNIYNIGCGQKASLLDLLDTLRMTQSQTITVDHHPEREGDVKYSFSDITNARTDLAYAPLIDTREGIHKTFEWYKNEKLK